jgi:ribosomal protein L11 methyltransferase
MDAYLSISCSIPSALEEELPTLLFDTPILGTEITSSHGDRVEVTVCLPGTAAGRVEEVMRLIMDAGGNHLVVGTVGHEDWMRNYRKTVRPFPVGTSWWIDPHPEDPTMAPKGRRRLVIPPRMAFGSGSHESTRLVLKVLETTRLRGRRVLDVGTGSGVLALAADVLGSPEVLGVDVDPVAVDIASQIRDLQEWRPRVRYVVGSAGCVAPGYFDVVLCNMISAEFIPLLDALIAVLSPDGKLVLSGLLVGEADIVVTELERREMMPAPMESVGDWASLTAGRRA